MTVPAKEVQAKSVPAAAVIQTVRALFILNGRKGYVGGGKNLASKCWSHNFRRRLLDYPARHRVNIRSEEVLAKK